MSFDGFCLLASDCLTEEVHKGEIQKCSKIYIDSVYVDSSKQLDSTDDLHIVCSMTVEIWFLNTAVGQSQLVIGRPQQRKELPP